MNGNETNMFLKKLFGNKKKNHNDKDRKQTQKSLTKVNGETNKEKNERVANRKGELGEYKIDIQLSQMPKDYMHLSDLLIKNAKSSTGYSQIDHVLITPYGLFVIETKNYQGTIYGGKDRKTWLINGKFKMMSPLLQNYGHIQALKNLIDVKYHPFFISMVSFTKRCTLKIGVDLRKIQSDEFVIYDIELSEFIQRKAAILKYQNKEPILIKDDIEKVYQALLNANIQDASIREQHVESIQIQKAADGKNTNNNCVICQKPVSKNVETYCLSNKKFKGKLYCYEHQKSL